MIQARALDNWQMWLTLTIMLCIWWNSKDVLYYKSLPRDVTTLLTLFIANNWDVLQTHSKKNYQQECVKWCYSKIMLARTLTWQKTLYRSWVGKSFCIHLIHLILHPQIFTFSALYGTTFKELPFRWKCAPKMVWWLQLKTTWFL